MNTASVIKDLSRFHTSDFHAYFVNPYNFSRTLLLFFWEIILERFRFRQDRRKDVQPRLDKHHRNYKYALVRATPDRGLVRVFSAANNPPVLKYLPPRTFYEGKELFIKIEANDPDEDELNYSVSGLPEGADFNSDELTITWLALTGQEGVHTVTITVSDGTDTDEQELVMTVLPDE